MITVRFLSREINVFIYSVKWTTDRSEKRERVRSQIERDTSDIRTHTFKSQQNTYIHISLYQMMINDKWRKLLYWSRYERVERMPREKKVIDHQKNDFERFSFFDNISIFICSIHIYLFTYIHHCITTPVMYRFYTDTNRSWSTFVFFFSYVRYSMKKKIYIDAYIPFIALACRSIVSKTFRKGIIVYFQLGNLSSISWC